MTFRFLYEIVLRWKPSHMKMTLSFQELRSEKGLLKEDQYLKYLRTFHCLGFHTIQLYFTFQVLTSYTLVHGEHHDDYFLKCTQSYIWFSYSSCTIASYHATNDPFLSITFLFSLYPFFILRSFFQYRHQPTIYHFRILVNHESITLNV